MKFHIDSEIKKSYTLPSEFYRNKIVFEESIDKIFTNTWQYITDTSVLKEPTQIHPFTYLEGVFPYCNLQLGIADPEKPETCFDIPEGHVDYGKKVYAYYFWMFPNLMFNFYPWGLSLNVVQPLSHNKTKVSFRTYTYANTAHLVNETRLDDTEIEDEAVVESVQKGIQSRFYKRGRFSPTMEQGVHHFHQLVSRFMNA